MNPREYLESTWSVLEAGNERRALIRTVTDFGLPADVWLGIDGNNRRELHLEVPLHAKIAKVPNVQGVHVVMHTTNQDGTPRRALVLRCAEARAHRVFTLFSADVLEQAVGTSNRPAKVFEVLATWREMFRRVATDSDSNLIGIYGELHELALLAAYSPGAIEAWQGPNRMPRDFERGRLGLEVKSTRTSNGSVEVHGLEQLWAKQFDVLALVVKHISSKPDGQTICELVEHLIDIGLDPTTLWDMLTQLELSKERLRETPGPRFVVNSTRYYLVTANSPVLTPDSLANGTLPRAVSRLSYHLDPGALSKCPPDVIERLHRGLAGA